MARWPRTWAAGKGVGKQFIILKRLGKTKSTIDSMDDVIDEFTRDIREKKTRVEMNKEFELIRQDAKIDNYLIESSSEKEDAVEEPIAVYPFPLAIAPADGHQYLKFDAGP